VRHARASARQRILRAPRLDFIDQPRWVDAKRSREIRKFDDVQPTFAEFHSRYELLVKPEPLRQLLLCEALTPSLFYER
jgi:hypothetical protein